MTQVREREQRGGNPFREVLSRPGALRFSAAGFDVEAVMTAAGGRPHWGKMHTRSADYLRRAYPRFDDFVALRDELDRERRFGNAYLTQVLGS